MSGPAKAVAIVVPIVLFLFGLFLHVVLSIGSAFFAGPSMGNEVFMFFLMIAIIIPIVAYGATPHSCPICRSQVWRRPPPDERTPLAKPRPARRAAMGKNTRLGIIIALVVVIGVVVYAAASHAIWTHTTADERAAAEQSELVATAAVAAARSAPDEDGLAAREFERAAAEWSAAGRDEHAAAAAAVAATLSAPDKYSLAAREYERAAAEWSAAGRDEQAVAAARSALLANEWAAAAAGRIESEQNAAAAASASASAAERLAAAERVAYIEMKETAVFKIGESDEYVTTAEHRERWAASEAADGDYTLAANGERAAAAEYERAAAAAWLGVQRAHEREAEIWRSGEKATMTTAEFRDVVRACVVACENVESTKHGMPYDCDLGCSLSRISEFRESYPAGSVVDGKYAESYTKRAVEYEEKAAAAAARAVEYEEKAAAAGVP